MPEEYSAEEIGDPILATASLIRKIQENEIKYTAPGVGYEVQQLLQQTLGNELEKVNEVFLEKQKKLNPLIEKDIEEKEMISKILNRGLEVPFYIGRLIRPNISIF